MLLVSKHRQWEEKTFRFKTSWFDRPNYLDRGYIDLRSTHSENNGQKNKNSKIIGIKKSFSSLNFY